MAVRLVAEAAPRELKIAIGLTVVGAALTAAELVVGRHLVGLLVDEPTRSTDASDLAPWLVVLGLLLVGTTMVSIALRELRILMHDLVHRRAMDHVIAASTAAELAAFEDSSFHDRVQLARDHAETYAWQVVWGIVTFATMLMAAVAVASVLLAVAPLLVPVAFVAYVPIGVIAVMNARTLYRLNYELAEVDRDRTYHERLLTGRHEAREIRAFGIARFLSDRHAELFDERIRNTRRVIATRTARALIGSSVTSLIVVGALAVIMLLAVDERITIGDAAVAVVALQQLSGRLRSSGDAFESMVEGVTFLRDFANLGELVKAGPSSPVTLRPPSRPARITVDSVAYRYPAGTSAALTNVSLKLESGQVLAIVGPNGAGKSTLAKLLCGLLSPTGGTIRWDDTDLSLCDPDAVRRLVGPVFQDSTRFEHSAQLAIGFGDVDRIDDRNAVRTAAKRAGAESFIATLPSGFDTRLSTSFSGGTDLSIGQWQRLAVARAYFRDAPIIVMDEPASSLDPRAERELFERLRELGRERIVVFVSHRFATVRRADDILVLLDGRVTERGTHDELMAVGGLYAELYTMQAEQFL